ncbi:MAG: iron ABC transporter permease [Alphaproteobacteria bacterium]|nr:iron ABC transporter permease [Alphaproteobacteria bacterium]
MQKKKMVFWSPQAVQISICALLLMPILALVITAMGDTEGLMRHLFETVLGRYFFNTIALMLGVAAVALVFGVSTAWVVSRYDFPLRQALEWMLVLPAAVPAYIIAYTYTDFLEYAGPVQSGLRAMLGVTSARDYWFPDIRSMPGAMLVMGAVLYPYVYITTRTAFRLTSTRLFEAARLSGGNIFTTIALPLARPAVVAGLALVMMEVVSDFGTVEYFALDTLTLGIFNVWLGMGNLTAAAQIALMAFTLILVLLGIERWAQSKRQVGGVSRGVMGVPQIKTSGLKSGLVIVICLLPIILGFAIPVGVLLSFIIKGLSASAPMGTATAIINTIGIAAISSAAIMLVAMAVGIIAQYQSGRFGRLMAAISASGYAVPGTILAIGVLGCVQVIDASWRWTTSSSNSLISGTMLVLVFAYLVRYQAVGYGAVQAGLKRLPINLMPASQVMGHGFAVSVSKVTLPLLRPSVLAGLLLTFVDIMKELPMTLLLSPFNFNTLATLTYQFAKDEMLEDAALPALLIVLAGLLPVIIINRSLAKPRHQR